MKLCTFSGFAAFRNASLLGLTLTLPTACGSSTGSGTQSEFGAATTSSTTSQQMYQSITAASASGKLDKAIKELGALSVTDYYKTMRVGVSNQAFTVDDMHFSGAASLVDSQADNIAAMSREYSSMADYWKALGITPGHITEAQIKAGLAQLSDFVNHTGLFAPDSTPPKGVATPSAATNSVATAHSASVESLGLLDTGGLHIPHKASTCNNVEIGVDACAVVSGSAGPLAHVLGGGDGLNHAGGASQTPLDKTLGGGGGGGKGGPIETPENVPTPLDSKTTGGAIQLNLDAGATLAGCAAATKAQRLLKCP